MGKGNSQRLLTVHTVWLGVLTALFIGLGASYIATTVTSFNDSTNALGRIGSVEEENITAVRYALIDVTSRLESLIMDMATNVTLIETGHCFIFLGAGRSVNYEYYSSTMHGETIFFIKFLPMSSPYQLTGAFFVLNQCTGTTINSYGNYYGIRRLAQYQKDAIVLSNPNTKINTASGGDDTYFVQIDDFLFELDFYNYGLTLPMFQITSPLLVQVPIAPVFLTKSDLPQGLLSARHM